MLKKTSYIVIMLLLLFGTTGLTIYRHYCGSNLVHTSVFAPHNCCGGHCTACHNEKIDIRITDKFESSRSAVDFTAAFKDLLKKHSLPTLLSGLYVSNIELYKDVRGDQCVKPFFNKHLAAGPSTPFLQVFLF